MLYVYPREAKQICIQQPWTLTKELILSIEQPTVELRSGFACVS